MLKVVRHIVEYIEHVGSILEINGNIFVNVGELLDSYCAYMGICRNILDHSCNILEYIGHMLEIY